MAVYRGPVWSIVLTGQMFDEGRQRRDNLNHPPTEKRRRLFFLMRPSGLQSPAATGADCASAFAVPEKIRRPLNLCSSRTRVPFADKMINFDHPPIRKMHTVQSLSEALPRVISVPAHQRDDNSHDFPRF
jgi:hypothetical protein